MRPEEYQEMKRLCEQIAVERDHATFTKLVEQLNQLFERKDKRLEKGDKTAV